MASVGGKRVINLNIPGVSDQFKKISGISLGGGLRGFIPQSTLNNDKTDESFRTRFILREGWNTRYPAQLQNAHMSKPALGPFRAVNNSGDLLSRQYYSCGGSNQVSQSRPQLSGLRGRMGHVQSLCDGTGIPAANCNTKYVYDSSDYIRFRKQNAVSKNYNDLTYGGDDSYASQSAIKRVRS